MNPMKKTAWVFAITLAASASAAVADGMPKAGATAAPCCAEPAWRGFYIGAGVGAGAVVHDVGISAGGIGSANFDGIGGEGVLGTVIVGYDFMVARNVVGGIFADFDFSGLSTDLNAAGLLNASIDHQHSWSIGGRLGVLTTPTTLWYATGGYTRASFDLSGSIGGTPFSVDLPDFNGFFIGGGVESQLRGNWSLRAEYRFTQFDSETVFSGGGINVDAEPSMHTARLALTYKFPRPEGHAEPLK
jgi:outer membrane immunogenic protein